MKKIYTIVTQQTMTKSFYGDANQQLFENRKEAVYFPLTAYLSTIISEEENFTVLALDSFDSVESHKNYELLKEELEAYYPGHVNVEKIDASFEHNQAGQIKTFNKLYKTFEENDDVYFDVTFGLRPIPMTVFVACNYAKKLLKNVNICNIIYAHYQFGKDDSFVHSIVDITSLFLLNNLIDSLSESKNPNPDYIINLFFNPDGQ